MKKLLFFITSLLINMPLVFYLFHTFHSEPQSKSITSNTMDTVPLNPDNQIEPFKIAILTPISHPSLQEIERGFTEKLRNKSKQHYAFSTYNANGNRTLMRSQLEEIIQADFDLIFTIATQPTLMAKEVTSKKNRLIPIVFGAASDPLGAHLVDSLESSGNHLTGTTDAPNHELQMSLLLKLKPDTKNALIVYDPKQGGGLEKDKQKIEAILKTKGINLKSLEVYSTNEVYQKTSSMLDAIDVIIVLKDNTVVSGIDGLVKLCNQQGITLFASYLDSVDKGAALGFGVQEYDFGAQAALQAQQILEQGIAPTEIPVKLIQYYKVKINTQTNRLQEIPLDTATLFLIKSGVVV